MISENLTNSPMLHGWWCCEALREVVKNQVEDEISYQCICPECGTHWWIEQVTVTPETYNERENYVKELMSEMPNS